MTAWANTSKSLVAEPKKTKESNIKVDQRLSKNISGLSEKHEEAVIKALDSNKQNTSTAADNVGKLPRN